MIPLPVPPLFSVPSTYLVTEVGKAVKGKIGIMVTVLLIGTFLVASVLCSFLLISQYRAEAEYIVAQANGGWSKALQVSHPIERGGGGA